MGRKFALLAALVTLGAVTLTPGGATADPTGICPDGMFLYPATTGADHNKDGTRDGTGTGDGFVCKGQDNHGGPDNNNVVDNLPLT
jgi:hypothetical protein